MNQNPSYKVLVCGVDRPTWHQYLDDNGVQDTGDHWDEKVCWVSPSDEIPEPFPYMGDEGDFNFSNNEDLEYVFEMASTRWAAFPSADRAASFIQRAVKDLEVPLKAEVVKVRVAGVWFFGINSLEDLHTFEADMVVLSENAEKT